MKQQRQRTAAEDEEGSSRNHGYDDHDDDHTTNSNVRIVHLMSLMPWNDGPSRRVPPSLLSADFATYLAVRDFNAFKSTFVKDLPQTCNITLAIDQRNSQRDPLVAVAALQEEFANPNHVVAVVGPMQSNQAVLVAELAGIYGYAVLSPGSTSKQLDDSLRFRTFGRTCPTNYGSSVALARYLTESLCVDTLVVAFTQDPFGRSYAADLETASTEFPLRVLPISIDEENLDQGIDGLLDTVQRETNEDKNFTYFFGAFGGDYQNVIVQLYRKGAIKNSNHWIIAEKTQELAGLTIQDNVLGDVFGAETRDSTFYNDLAIAINGTACLSFRPDPEAISKMEDSLRDVRADPVQWEDYVGNHISQDPNEDIESFLDVPPTVSIYSLFAYDAVIALGLAACQLDRDITGIDLFRSLPRVRFEGASGRVEFLPKTVTRIYEDMPYSLTNIRSLLDIDGIIAITGPEAAILKSNHIVQNFNNFTYADGSLNQPPQKNVYEEMNLSNNAVLGCMYGMAIVSMLLPLCAGIWTYRNRDTPCVRESQPIFLGILCLGTFLTGSTIVFLTFQEPMSLEVLDAGCKVAPWLFFTGMSLSVSALFTKIYRINRVFNCAKAFQRVKIRAIDVAKPLATLTIITCSLLAALTIVAPLVWLRDVKISDRFERPTSSTGMCQPQEKTMYFVIPLLCVTILAIVVANYQSYLARNLPSRWNESLYVSLTNFILLETFIIGLPVMLLVQGEPTAFKFVLSLMILVSVGAIMVPAFLPKILIDSTPNNVKVLRLNQDVSAYPNARNPMGLFGGLSMRLSTPSRRPIVRPARSATELTPVNPISGYPKLSSVVRGSVASKNSLGTQGTSGSTLVAKNGSSKEQRRKTVTFGGLDNYEVGGDERGTLPRAVQKADVREFITLDDVDTDNEDGNEETTSHGRTDSLANAHAQHKPPTQQDYVMAESRKKSSLDLSNPNRLSHSLDFVDMDSDDTDFESTELEDKSDIAKTSGSLGSLLPSRDPQWVKAP